MHMYAHPKRSKIGCPYGYELKSGDLPGYGNPDAGGKTDGVNSITACAELCNTNALCQSIEYSTTTKVCNRHNQKVPTEGPYQDYIFCSRDESSGLLLLESSGLDCQQRCAALQTCNFWDWNGRNCRLYSDDKGGAQDADNFSAGHKGCSFTGVYTRIICATLWVFTHPINMHLFKRFFE